MVLEDVCPDRHAVWVLVRPGCGIEPGRQPGRSGQGVKGNPCPDATGHTRARGPTSARAHSRVRWRPRPAQPRARLHTGREPVRCVWRSRGKPGAEHPNPGAEPYGPRSASEDPGLAGAQGGEGGTDGAQRAFGAVTVLCVTGHALPRGSAPTERGTKSDPNVNCIRERSVTGMSVHRS